MYLTSNTNNFQELFPRAYACIITRGTAEGTILKFANLYLKIYNSDGENMYVIKGYRYGKHEDLPIFEDTIAASELRDYADRVNRLINY